MIVDIRYDLLEKGRYSDEAERNRLLFADRFFYHVCTLAIYGGLAAIFVHLRKEALTNEMMEQGQPGVGGLAEPQPAWNQQQQSRDHSQDPIFNGK